MGPPDSRCGLRVVRPLPLGRVLQSCPVRRESEVRVLRGENREKAHRRWPRGLPSPWPPRVRRTGAGVAVSPAGMGCSHGAPSGATTCPRDPPGRPSSSCSSLSAGSSLREGTTTCSVLLPSSQVLLHLFAPSYTWLPLGRVPVPPQPVPACDHSLGLWCGGQGVTVTAPIPDQEPHKAGSAPAACWSHSGGVGSCCRVGVPAGVGARVPGFLVSCSLCSAWPTRGPGVGWACVIRCLLNDCVTQ